MPDTHGYIFADEHDRSAERFRALSELYDASTTGYIERLGLARGCACLEIGAGGGSIARWLAALVSPGRVVATDRDMPAFDVSGLANLELLRHDIAVESLPDATFDFVHARLVLMHLPEPELAVSRMVQALRPGGRVLLEEFDVPPLTSEAAWDVDATTLRTSIAFRAAMERSGVDMQCGRRLPGMMRAHRVVSIGGQGRMSLWTGRSAGAHLMRSNYVGLKERMIDDGLILAADFDADLARLDDPDFVAVSPTMWSVWGRLP
jgi:SAM-dependent methyltransferase